MNYILFDGPARNALLPFTFTRPVADILIGILIGTLGIQIILHNKIDYIVSGFNRKS